MLRGARIGRHAMPQYVPAAADCYRTPCRDRWAAECLRAVVSLIYEAAADRRKKWHVSRLVRAARRDVASRMQVTALLMDAGLPYTRLAMCLGRGAVAC
jgi:hypothetical protein